MSKIKLYDSFSRTKKDFVPIDDKNVRMYVCGPTVYDEPHIGNARPVIVFDVLYRLLRHTYGSSNVTYARNITDIDDKIIDATNNRKPTSTNWANQEVFMEHFKAVTDKHLKTFEDDMAFLGALAPSVQPKATDHIAEMQNMIAALVAKGHAYVTDSGEVMFSVSSDSRYGSLANRELDKQRDGVRVDVNSEKENQHDFALWKPYSATNLWKAEPYWDSPWGKGRPGWHIECSAMSEKHLGKVFDIHGGGIDLLFPHHENELAQSCCANDTDRMANHWMHNGFLTVNGRKMAKSVGNTYTITNLCRTEFFGDTPRKWSPMTLRMLFMMTHYRDPIDFTVDRMEMAENIMTRWPEPVDTDVAPDEEMLEYLSDDLNIPKAIERLHFLAIQAKSKPEVVEVYSASMRFLGFKTFRETLRPETIAHIESYVDQRIQYAIRKDWDIADNIKRKLNSHGIELTDKTSKEGIRTTTWFVADQSKFRSEAFLNF